jgi:beta-lactamase class A
MRVGRKNMLNSRREFLVKSAAAVGTMQLASPAMAEDKTTPDAILSLFKGLPGEVAVKIYAPAANGKPEFVVQANPAKTMFVGSAIKTFILCEALRQSDGPEVVKTLRARQLNLDASVWSLDSATFNPPNLIGKVSERTALEAMIMHSDNTGTDMCLKQVGPEKVREFVASAGLKSCAIPESTRSLFGYMLGAKDYKNFSWEALGAAANDALVNSPMNTVETMACSADDFVSYYSRALQGEFFKSKETLNEFRRIQSLGDAIWLLPLPLGVSSFCKGGSIDVQGFHAVCAPGAMLVGQRWLYFCVTINWDAKAERDPATVAAFTAAASGALSMAKDKVSA